MQKYPSGLLENAVNEFARLPGVGMRTALRFALNVLKWSKEEAIVFANAVNDLRSKVNYCRICHNICDTEICNICADTERDASTVCVVENIRDVMAIEGTGQFHGLYHVLGGIISPMDGMGPSDLNIDSLVKRAESGEAKEIILALSTTMEGDTTNFYIFRKLEHTNVKISIIARGISVGDEIEYADEITLGRAIINRTEFLETGKTI
jgi:recombination protein RecR